MFIEQFIAAVFSWTVSDARLLTLLLLHYCDRAGDIRAICANMNYLDDVLALSAEDAQRKRCVLLFSFPFMKNILFLRK